MGRRSTEDNPGAVFLWDGTLIAHGDPASLTIDVPTDDIDGHVASIDANGGGEARFYHQGPDQSVLAISDKNGLIEGYSYSAFGEVSVWSQNGRPSTGNRLLFQGQLFDPTTATYSMRNREYSPAWGDSFRQIRWALVPACMRSLAAGL
jgi:hypothetical protein